MRFFIDITINMTDSSCYLNRKDALRIPDECLCVILTLCIMNVLEELEHNLIDKKL